MRARRVFGTRLAVMACAVGVFASVSSAAASSPQLEPRRITLPNTSYRGGTTVSEGTLNSRHDIGKCTNNVPVQIYTRNEDGTPVRVAAGDTNGDGFFSIEIPNKPGTYVAVARSLTVPGGSGNDRIRCKTTRSEPMTYSG